MFIIAGHGSVRLVGLRLIRDSNFCNQMVSKLVPLILSLFTQGHGQGKGAPFPGVVKNQLAALAR